MQHFISLEDHSKEQIQRILELAAELKAQIKAGTRQPILAQKTLGFVFEKPSLRTRVSFEGLMKQHAGSTVYLGEEAGFGKREPLRDFVPILSSYVDLLVMRTKQHDLVTQAAELSQCPIVNGLTDYNHPCQALADILTTQEIFGDLSSVKMAYVGDSNNVTRSLAVICSKLGIHLSIASPDGYQFDQATIDQFNEGNDWVQSTNDPVAAVSHAHVIYTDVWTSMGQEAETKQRLKDFKDFQVNQSLMAQADKNAKFLHCLPARREEEVSTEVCDGPQSAIIHQAENRLHAQKGMVVWLLNEANQWN
jgi:ornithine carbamoyltransferase